MKKLITTLATVASIGCLAQTNLLKNPGWNIGTTNWLWTGSYEFGSNYTDGTPCAVLGITNNCSVKQIGLPFATAGQTNYFGAWVGVAHEAAPNPSKGRFVTLSITRNYHPGVPSASVTRTIWIPSDGQWHWMQVSLPGANTPATNCAVSIRGACVYADNAVLLHQ